MGGCQSACSARERNVLDALDELGVRRDRLGGVDRSLIAAGRMRRLAQAQDIASLPLEKKPAAKPYRRVRVRDEVLAHILGTRRRP